MRNILFSVAGKQIPGSQPTLHLSLMERLGGGDREFLYSLWRIYEVIWNQNCVTKKENMQRKRAFLCCSQNIMHFSRKILQWAHVRFQGFSWPAALPCIKTSNVLMSTIKNVKKCVQQLYKIKVDTPPAAKMYQDVCNKGDKKICRTIVCASRKYCVLQTSLLPACN